MRVASRSIRCRGALERLLDELGLEGVMYYAGHEAADLAAEGFDDLLVACPVGDREELRRVADGTRIVPTVDSEERVERAGTVAIEAGPDVPPGADLDCSTEHLGVYFGVSAARGRTARGWRPR